MKELNQYDVVALTEKLEEQRFAEVGRVLLHPGQVGTIVEVFNRGEAYLVDFVDKNGGTYALSTGSINAIAL